MAMVYRSPWLCPSVAPALPRSSISRFGVFHRLRNLTGRLLRVSVRSLTPLATSLTLPTAICIHPVASHHDLRSCPADPQRPASSHRRGGGAPHIGQGKCRTPWHCALPSRCPHTAHNCASPLPLTHSLLFAVIPATKQAVCSTSLPPLVHCMPHPSLPYTSPIVVLKTTTTTWPLPTPGPRMHMMTLTMPPPPHAPSRSPPRLT